MLSTSYGCEDAHTPNFDRLARHAVTFDNCYVGSMPCMPARRELHTGRYNFLHRSWGPLEPFDDSMPEMLKKHGIYTHLTTDHQHYWEDGGATYHQRYNSFEFSRGQEGGIAWKGHVKEPDMSGFRRSESDRAKKEAMKLAGMPDMNRQDAVNRQYLSHAARYAPGGNFPPPRAGVYRRESRRGRLVSADRDLRSPRALLCRRTVPPAVSGSGLHRERI